MALSAFDDKTSPPGDGSLHEMLGRTGGLWTRLRADLQKAIPVRNRKDVETIEKLAAIKIAN